MLNLLKYELQSRLGAVLGWGIGLGLFGTLYIALFPEMGDQMADLADLPIYQSLGMDLGSFAGFIASSAVQFTPIILGIYAIITSTESLAGEEDRGTLELVLAMPMHRWQIVSMKAIALAIVSFLILAIAGIGYILTLNAISASVDVDVTTAQLIFAVLNSWPVTMAFMMMGLFLGAYLPNRRSASLALTVIFITSYFGENMVSMVGSLDWVKPFSLFTYFDSSITVFTGGVKTGDILILLGVAVVFFVLALVSFQRRNVTVGAWPWNRGKIPTS
jgi:ABC-2 type transport system permease protein